MVKDKKGFGDRDYRLLQVGSDIKYFNVKVKQTDLAIGIDNKAYSDSLVELCYQEIRAIRRQLEEYIIVHPQFQTSLIPVATYTGAPEIALKMAEAAAVAGVGPMAAVAGAVADHIGQVLKKYSTEIIVENGGDIYLLSARERHIAVYAGDSPFSYKIGIKIQPQSTPAGICTSSGTIGHSLSFGVADAVVIIGSTAVMADAAATQAGNLVKDKFNLEKAVEYIKALDKNLSILAIKDEQMMAWGNIEIIPL